MTEEPSALFAYIESHEAFQEDWDWIGDWQPGDKTISLRGNFTPAQVLALGTFMMFSEIKTKPKW